MPGRSSVSLTERDATSAKTAMARVSDLEGISYASVAEFIRDALRRRVEAINEAWRRLRMGGGR